MTQKTIKAIYQKPVTYKLIRDGYKTVTNSFTPDDNTPSIMNLSTPSEIYNPNLQYTVDTSLDGEPVLTFDSFISPDNETIDSTQYCYAPKGKDYNYTMLKQKQAVYDNFDSYGSPSISNDGLFVNLSNSNYLVTKTNFTPGNYSWEVQTKVKIGNNVSSERAFFDHPYDQRSFRIGLAGTVIDRWQLLVSNGSSWINTSQHYGSYSVLPNTVYWIKAGFDGINTYYLDYSLDGEHYTRDVQYTSTVKIQQDLPVYLRGTAVEYIDLSCTCIKINDQVWWTPYRDPAVENFDITGSLTITNKIAYGFSVNDYISLQNLFPSNPNSYEINIKVITPSSWGNDDYAVIDFNGNDIFLEGQTDTFCQWNGSIKVSGSTIIEPNTMYILKLVYDGNNYKFYINDNLEYTTNYNLDSPVLLRVGSRLNCQYWPGSIDLNSSYIKINGEDWWIPYTNNTEWEEVEVQIPGMLDESVVTDNWNQNQNYKLYQLKQQDESSNLQLTSNNITNEGQKYNQYIDQITIPARNYKWYYHNVETGVYDNYDIIGSPTINKNTGVVSGFTSSNYLKLPNQFPIVGSYKMIFNTIYKTSTTGYEQSFFARDDNVNKTLYFQYANNKIAYWNDVNYEGVTSFTNNVRYWICMEFDFSTLDLKVYSLVDNGLYNISNLPNINTWTSEINVTFSINDFANKYFRIGTNASTNHWYCGTVDLSKCIIYKDDAVWWSPMSIKDKWIANKSIYDYSATGLYADTLDFTKSYIGVNSSEYHKYSEPEVCLMPIDGGETTGEYSLNCNEVGTIDFDKNTSIVNNFGTNNYLTKIVQLSNNWEIYCKFTTPVTTVTGGQKILSIGHQTDEHKYLLFTLANNGTNIYVKTSNDGSSHVVDSATNAPYSIQQNTTYYAKIGSNGSQTYFYLSTSGYNNMTQIIIVNNPTLIPSTDLYIGSDPYFTAKGAFGGSINLSETCIKINDQLWWTAATNNIKHNQYLIPTTADKIINGNSFGDIMFDDDTGIVSAFSTTSGITLPETFPSTISNFDMIFKGSITNFDDDNVLLGYANTSEGYIGVIDRDTHSFSYWFDSWTQGQTTINFNTYYWFRVIYNGSNTKGYILLDNGYNLDNLPALSQWSEEWTLDNNKFNGRLLNLGYNFATTSEHWTGNIDLDNSVIRINGSNWWTGTKYILDKYSSNVIKVGNVYFNEYTGDLSNFSNNDYAYCSDSSIDFTSPWEMILKFTTRSNLDDTIVGENTNCTGIRFGTTNGNFFLLCGNGNWFNTSSNIGTFSVQQNTTYWAKIGWTGTQYYVEYSLDGITFVTDISYNSSNNVTYLNYPFKIGACGVTMSYNPQCIIHLNETSFKVNNQIVWNGVNHVLGHYGINVNKVGNVNFDSNTSELTNFSDSDYAYCNNSSVIFTSPWEITVKFNSPFSIDSNIIGCNVDTNGLRFRIDSNTKKLGLLLGKGSASSGWLINATTTATFQPNTDYWVKIGWTGTVYYLKYSTNGITYTTDISINNSTAITFDTYPFRIGNNGASITRPFDGTIYLKDCTFEVNNEIVWIGATSNFRSISGCLYNYRDDGQQHDFDVYYDSNYTQPILVWSGEIYSQGTKVDTITIPEHKLWTYGNGGVWTERGYEPESSGESGVVEESYTPTPSPAVVIPEITLGCDVIVNLTGTPSAFQSFTIDGDTYTSSDFINDRLVITLPANQTYTWTATAQTSGTISPSSGSFLLDNDVTINIQCQYNYFSPTNPGALD